MSNETLFKNVRSILTGGVKYTLSKETNCVTTKLLQRTMLYGKKNTILNTSISYFLTQTNS